MAPRYSQGSSERHVSLESVSGYASKLPCSRILWNYLHIFTIIISLLLAPVSPFDSGAMLEDCVGFSFFPSDLSFHFLFLSGSDDPKSFPSDSQEGICLPLPIETSTKVIFVLIQKVQRKIQITDKEKYHQGIFKSISPCYRMERQTFRAEGTACRGPEVERSRARVVGVEKGTVRFPEMGLEPMPTP